MKLSTAQSYHVRLTRVLTHLVRHLDDKVTLEDLAAVAAFSPFHFHRIFRSIAGETVGDLTRRLRLERAGQQLRSGAASVTEVALGAGYESPEAFARAFRRACGFSPSAYRRAFPPPAFSKVQPRVHFNPSRLTIELEPFTGGPDMNVAIESLPARRVASIRLIGPYNEAGALFERLFAWAGVAGLDPRRLRAVSLSYDDPSAVPAEALRSDACLELPADFDPEASGPSAVLPEEAEVRTLPACRYAVHRLTGSYDGIHRTYQRLFRDWLPGSGEEIADLPCMEVYLNDCRALPEAEWETDLCIPLKG